MGALGAAVILFFALGLPIYNWVDKQRRRDVVILVTSATPCTPSYWITAGRSSTGGDDAPSEFDTTGVIPTPYEEHFTPDESVFPVYTGDPVGVRTAGAGCGQMVCEIRVEGRVWMHETGFEKANCKVQPLPPK